MASRREEKERLRQIRVEAEERERQAQRRRLYIGYALGGLIGAAVLAGIVVLIVSSGGGAQGNAHIVNCAGGACTTEGLQPDERVGTKTKPGRLATAARLPQAAKAAGCVL